MTKIHIAVSADPPLSGGSLIAICGKPITKSFFPGLIDNDVFCEKCKLALWEGRYITPVCEFEEVPELMDAL